MKDILIGALGYIPGIIMTSRRQGDNLDNNKIRLNWPQLFGTLIMIGLSALVSSYLTSRDNAKDIQNIAIAANKMELQVNTICDKLAVISESIAIIKTRQNERLERETTQGIRKR
jgi:hypothetical protein